MYAFRYFGIACIAFLSAGGALADQGLEQFRLQLRWHHQAQFAGFYIADALGYYESEGLEISLVEGGETVHEGLELRAGRVDAIVEWLPTALSYRMDGIPVLNVAQLFQGSSLMIVCDRSKGIIEQRDLMGKRVFVWGGGSNHALSAWLRRNGAEQYVGGGLTSPDVVLRNSVAQLSDEFDCFSATSYNEIWEINNAGVSIAGLTIFRLSDVGYMALEDGIYIDEHRLADPVYSDQLIRFVRASLEGWRYALRNPQQAVEIMLERHPHLSRDHQLEMLLEVARLIDVADVAVGKMRPDAYQQTIDAITGDMEQSVRSALQRDIIWTDRIWRAATEADGSPSLLSSETAYHLDRVLSLKAFYLLDLIGTLAFGIAGFARAQQKNYDVWGAIVLTSLPAVGGGTIRDLLVGGDRHPPFIFADPVYIYIVLSIVLVGALMRICVNNGVVLAERFPKNLFFIDTIGLAAFCIIGAKVAIIANLDWFWIPCLSALTCAGGGVLLDIVTREEPRTFRGVFYEEIAIIGGFFWPLASIWPTSLRGCLYLLRQAFVLRSSWCLACD